MPTFSWAIVLALSFLGLGVLLRRWWPVLRTWFIPASVAGGLVGWGALIATGAIPNLSEQTARLSGDLRSWPGPLLAIVFACLLFIKPGNAARHSASGPLLAALMVWIIVLGEVAVGLLVTAIAILPRVDVPPAFGQLIEAGFAGGHGTATALGTVFRDVLDFQEGLDIGLFVATVGLIYSILSGVILVNIGVRRGWTRETLLKDTETAAANAKSGAPFQPARVSLQLLLICLVVAIGYGLQQLFIWLVGLARDSGVSNDLPLENVPLFLFTLIAGLLSRKLLVGLSLGGLIDNRLLSIIMMAVMDVLIVAAIMSLRLESVAAYLGPVCLLLAAGFGWTAFCLVVISPRVLPKDRWFELGMLNYGMSTGTTAQGMILLRMIDPQLRSGAAEDYAMAAPASAPFIGGGLLTLSMPLILEQVGSWPVVIALWTTIAAIYLVASGVRRRVG